MRHTLAKALAVVEFLLKYSEETHDCKTCSKGSGVSPKDEPHDEDCPLVVGEFVTREGQRR